jgi:hypothetical protein
LTEFDAQFHSRVENPVQGPSNTISRMNPPHPPERIQNVGANPTFAGLPGRPSPGPISMPMMSYGVKFPDIVRYHIQRFTRNPNHGMRSFPPPAMSQVVGGNPTYARPPPSHFATSIASSLSTYGSKIPKIAEYPIQPSISNREHRTQSDADEGDGMLENGQVGTLGKRRREDGDRNPRKGKSMLWLRDKIAEEEEEERQWVDVEVRGKIVQRYLTLRDARHDAIKARGRAYAREAERRRGEARQLREAKEKSDPPSEQ